MAATPARKVSMGQLAADPDTSLYSGRVAARIRSLRKAAGLSVSELADKLLALKARVEAGKAPQYLAIVASIKADDNRAMQARINHYESGRAALPPDLYPVWSHLLKVDIHELLPAK
jgi:transcriptional regulator with XRE-family HTH domain